MRRDAVPVLIPSLGDELDFDAVLASVDGILLTGSPSNVEPQHYAGPASDAGTMHDPHRDATTLPMIPRVVASGMPLFAVCRGFQEMNVAYGGTLWQKVQEQPGMRDHREDKNEPLEVQYGPAHEVELVTGGLLRGIAGADRVDGQFAALAGSRPPRRRSRRRGARPGRPRRGLQCARGARIRARGAVAPRVAGNEKPVLAGLVRSLRRGGKGARKRKSIMSTPIQQFFKEHGISEVEAIVPDMAGIARGKIDARDEVRRGRGHAHAREHLPADRHRRVPGGRPRRSARPKSTSC